MTPEEKAARRVLDRHGLVPPYNILGLASQYAEIVEDVPNISGDAIVIDCPGSFERPLVILNKNRTSPTRRRFTLAHELGHILIPWHFGTISCSPNESEVYVAGDYGSVEAEANRFAAELLMPIPWLMSFIAGCSSIGDIFEGVMGTAGVSPEAARIKLVKCLPPGYICVVLGQPGERIRTEASHGTPLNLFVDYTERGDRAGLIEKLDRLAEESHVHERSQRSIRWWRMPGRQDVPDSTDYRCSTEIIRSIIESTAFSEIKQLAVGRQINGMVGATNTSAAAREAGAIYHVLKLRFSRKDVLEDEHLGRIVLHEDFETFLVNKSKELEAGTNKSRSKRPTSRRHLLPPDSLFE